MGGDYFADTDRYGVLFYGMLFVMTFVGMLVGAFIPKLMGVSNFQSRALSLETGLRNTSLSMAIAILIQDLMGDFYSAMFFTSAIFGLWMFFAGGISIALFKTILPVEDNETQGEKRNCQDKGQEGEYLDVQAFFYKVNHGIKGSG